MTDEEQAVTKKHEDPDFYLLREDLKAKYAKLYDLGIEAVNMSRDLASSEARIKKMYEKACNENEKVAGNYRRLMVRVLDILADFERVPQGGRAAERTSPRTFQRLLGAVLTRTRRTDTLPGSRGTGRESVDNDLVGYFQTMLLDAVRTEGVRTIHAEPGTKFDPAVHEVGGKIVNSKYPDGTIARVLELGYVQGSDVLKKVRVTITLKKAVD